MVYVDVVNYFVVYIVVSWVRYDRRHPLDVCLVVFTRELHGDGDDGIFAVTAVIPR